MRLLLRLLVLLSLASPLPSAIYPVDTTARAPQFRDRDGKGVEFTAPSTDPGNASLDGFNRLRVSMAQTTFEGDFIRGFNEDTWTSNTSTGGSVVVDSAQYVSHSAYSSITLAASAATGVSATVRSRQYLEYQKGKSQLIMMTGNFLASASSAGTDVSKYIGYFDDFNGIFFKLRTVTATHTLSVGWRQNGNDTTIPQSEWNVDRLDGSGGSTNPSRITLSNTSSNIYGCDFEWLGVGSIRWFVVIDGQIIVVHQNKWANRGNLSTYMRTPNLPVSWQIRGDVVGATQRMIGVCAQVASESGRQFTGIQHYATREGVALSTISAGGYYPVVALRALSSSPTVRIRPTNVSVITSSTTNAEWILVVNPGGLSGGTWRSITGTAAEMNTGMTVTADTDNVLCKLGGGYFSAAINGAAAEFSRYPGTGTDARNNTRDILVLCVRKLGAGADDFYGGLSFTEE